MACGIVKPLPNLPYSFIPDDVTSDVWFINYVQVNNCLIELTLRARFSIFFLFASYMKEGMRTSVEGILLVSTDIACPCSFTIR